MDAGVFLSVPTSTRKMSQGKDGDAKLYLEKLVKAALQALKDQDDSKQISSQYCLV
jgi:hypothetical protein